MDREESTARKRRLIRKRWRARQSQETLIRMRAADNEYHRRREGETQEERQKRLEFLSEYRERIRQQQRQDIVNQFSTVIDTKRKTLWYNRLSSEVEGFLICQERVNGATTSTVNELIRQNRRITTREIAVELSISKGTVHHIIHKKPWLWQSFCTVGAQASVRESEDSENGCLSDPAVSTLKPSAPFLYAGISV
ncbi:hypothetical protein AVEN_59225-1 [Araneus ventricosus]|uniref:Uncharacterized protein n=1 Tax=Araneus ventricosus TaxID=182803 RepID=A0A4Y2D127_ARAVE|nr:hypothetical protein AVEN_59225-1 [Araneus ventricosus]